jgi:hypothetical protein
VATGAPDTDLISFMHSLHGTLGGLLGYGLVLGASFATLWRRGARITVWWRWPLWSLAGAFCAAAVSGLATAGIPAGPGAPALRLAFALAALVAAGWLVGRGLSPRRPDDGLKRGALLIGGAPPPVRTPGHGTLTFAGIPLAAGDEAKHFKLIGTTGTGKSTAIRGLLAAAIARGDRAVIADAGGEYLRDFFTPSRGDVLINPFDDRGSRWNPFLEVQSPHDPEELARALISDTSGAEQAWRQYARVFVAALLRRLVAGGIGTTAELWRLLTVAPVDELRTLLEGSPAQPLLEPGNERMFGSVRAVAGTCLAALAHLQAKPGADFSVRDWVRRGAGLLFLPYSADQVASLQTLVSAWMRIAILEAMSGHGRDQMLWFVVDELDALGAIDGLKDALARLRKFGGCCVLGFQSIAQVRAVYGSAEAQTIVENCGNTLILRCSASEQGGTAGFAAALIGEREILRPDAAAAWGGPPRHAAAPLHVMESAVLPAEIEQLPDLQGFVKVASRPEWRRVRLGP